MPVLHSRARGTPVHGMCRGIHRRHGREGRFEEALLLNGGLGRGGQVVHGIRSKGRGKAGEVHERRVLHELGEIDLAEIVVIVRGCSSNLLLLLLESPVGQGIDGMLERWALHRRLLAVGARGVRERRVNVMLLGRAGGGARRAAGGSHFDWDRPDARVRDEGSGGSSG